MDTSIESLKGKTLTEVRRYDGGDGDVLEFHAQTGEVYRMWHYQDCCESVDIEDIVGDLDDLIGSPILEAEEAENSTEPPPEGKGDDSNLWTFYKLGTVKGHVTIRWFGSSNGYYSESVSFALLKPPIRSRTEGEGK